MIALDTGADKRALCASLGAESFIDFMESKDLVGDIKKATGGLGPHAAVVAASSAKAYEQALDYIRNGGTLVVVGLPADAYVRHLSLCLFSIQFFWITHAFRLIPDQGLGVLHGLPLPQDRRVVRRKPL